MGLHKRVIDDCDYYLLIIGGRYGSTTAEGISYTEKEYDYAIQRGMKVVAFLHEDPDSIPLSKSEQTPELRAQLKAFQGKSIVGQAGEVLEVSRSTTWTCFAVFIEDNQNVSGGRLDSGR